MAVIRTPWDEGGTTSTMEPGHALLWQSFVHGAQAEGQWPLDEVQWQIAWAVLEHYWREGEAPSLVRVARATGLHSRTMFDRFPFGPIQTVLELAGLPYPTGHARARGSRGSSEEGT